jgi:hypothetical protein
MHIEVDSGCPALFAERKRRNRDSTHNTHNQQRQNRNGRSVEVVIERGIQQYSLESRSPRERTRAAPTRALPAHTSSNDEEQHNRKNRLPKAPGRSRRSTALRRASSTHWRGRCNAASTRTLPLAETFTAACSTHPQPRAVPWKSGASAPRKAPKELGLQPWWSHFVTHREPFILLTRPQTSHSTTSRKQFPCRNA